ncbi:Dolichyl-phosphate-mannose-protein mannosyltransferase [Pseudarcicella hirudinis]|uniref:Dolichyl-phosphate-mannose-protein mannosyltransferase n=1 Tax=Pseudarcicella hirudinis TaxID=1079859 RepID=A0A1I5VH58_9BACT|nr:glycosyltransferase family 39 protein [Pseudarcicella hirudinis]SFQ06751.1 Dolichyl-phosphate-mannose-protein mannosyltransferase [Pseudarcicella hirudinis]
MSQSIFSSPRLQCIFLFLIILLASVLRITNLGKHAIFFDEKSTVLISQAVALEGNNQKDVFYTEGKTTFTPKEFWKPKNIEDFYDAIRRGDIGNSPAYYGVLHLWIEAFGLSDFAIRLLSVFFSCGTIFLLFFFIKEHFKNVKLALAGSLLMAIEPFFIAYSQQARNYSMSFFFALLATHLFLKIVKKENNSGSRILYISYGIVAGICLLSHFLTATVFMAHGFYVLLFVRKWNTWLFLILSLAIGLSAFTFWIKFGGGNYTFDTLSYQAKMYYKIAHSVPNPHAGTIDPATPGIVLKKSLPIFSDLFIVSNGFSSYMTGKKNMILVIFSIMVSLVSLIQYRKTSRNLWLGILLGWNLIASFLYTTGTFQYIELVNCVILCYCFRIFWMNETDPEQRRLLTFMAILAFFPTIFLILFTFKNGHTFGLTQRYSGFSFPYSIIFVALAIFETPKLGKPLQYIVWVLLLVQVFFVGKTIHSIHEDISPKYTYRDKARIRNPHYKIAMDIRKMYQTGDTVIYPSWTEGEYGAYDNYTKDIKKSFLDAQLVNLYLPKDAEFTQTVDAFNPNKVFLKKKDGQKIELFDFKGTTYRY